MIGLPTKTASRTSSRDTPASAQTREINEPTASRTAFVSASRPSAFIITYETRLIRSSPKRICGLVVPVEASVRPESSETRWAAMVVEPISTATPRARL